MVAHQFLGRSICCEVPFDQVGATCQVGGRHGGAGLGAGLTRHQALLPHEPAHRLWTGCNTIAFQDFVDPSITVGLFGVVEEIRHKNGEFFTAFLGF